MYCLARSAAPGVIHQLLMKDGICGCPSLLCFNFLAAKSQMLSDPVATSFMSRGVWTSKTARQNGRNMRTNQKLYLKGEGWVNGQGYRNDYNDVRSSIIVLIFKGCRQQQLQQMPLCNMSARTMICTLEGRNRVYIDQALSQDFVINCGHFSLHM